MMKKNWHTSLLTGLLAAVLLLSLSACGGSSGTAPGLAADKSEGVVGTWETDVDMSDTMRESLATDKLELDLDDVSFVIKLRLSFNDDGTYTVKTDEDQARSEVSKLIGTIKKPLVDAIKKELEDSGINVSDFLKMTGDASLEDYVGKLLGDALDEEALINELVGADTSGSYELKDGKVYFDGETEAGAELKDGKLIVDDEDASGVSEELLPLEFKRVR